MTSYMYLPTTTQETAPERRMFDIRCMIVGPRALWQICCTANAILVTKTTISEAYGRLWVYPRFNGQLFSLETIDGYISSVRVQSEEIILDFMYLTATFRGNNGYLSFQDDQLKPVLKLDCYTCQVAMNAPAEFKSSLLDVIRIESEETKFREEELQLLPKAIMRSTDSPFACPICREPVVENDAFRDLGCGDRFHLTCIDEWLLQRNTCPECGIEVTV